MAATLVRSIHDPARLLPGLERFGRCRRRAGAFWLAVVAFCPAHRQQPGLRGIIALPVARHRPIQQDTEADDSSTTTIGNVLAYFEAFSFN